MSTMVKNPLPTSQAPTPVPSLHHLGPSVVSFPFSMSHNVFLPLQRSDMGAPNVCPCSLSQLKGLHVRTMLGSARARSKQLLLAEVGFAGYVRKGELFFTSLHLSLWLLKALLLRLYACPHTANWCGKIASFFNLEGKVVNVRWSAGFEACCVEFNHKLSTWIRFTSSPLYRGNSTSH